MQYDRQVIFYIPTGSTLQAEKAVKTNAQNLHGKHATQSTLVEWTKTGPGVGVKRASDTAAGQLTNHSRVYLVSHANSIAFAGLSYSDLATLLVTKGGVTAAQRVVLVACEAGKETTTDPFQDLINDFARDNNFAASMLDVSYAQNFHWVLGKEHNLYTEVAARTEWVAVASDGRKWTQPNAQTPYVHKRPDSKIIWSWDATHQQQVRTKPY